MFEERVGNKRMEKYHIDKSTTVQMVALKVKDLEKQLDFYQRILKFDILSEENGMAFLGLKETGESLFALLEDPEALPSPYTHNGLNHIGLVVPTRKKLSKIYRHLEEANYPILELIDYGYAEAIVIKDPEFNVIKIYWDKEFEMESFATVQEPIDEKELLSETTEPYGNPTTKSRVGHIQLNVFDIEKSQDFYENVLGFKMRDVKFRGVRYLTASDYHHHISLRHSQQLLTEAPDDEHLGLDYITFNLSDMNAMDNLKEHLEKQEIAFFYNKGKQVLQLDDPNGIHIWFRIQGNN